MKVIINPIVKRYDTFRRTEAGIGQSEAEIIATSTVVKGKHNSLLLSNLEPQAESSEPLPEFSRNAQYGHERFEKARKLAESLAKALAKSE